MSTDFVSLFTGMSERDIGYLLKNVVQRSINDQLTSSDISSVDNKTPVLITNSKDIELLTDLSIYGLTNIEAPTTYTMTEEPDGNNLRIWLKFENAGELRDWSYQKNKSFAVGANTMPGLFIKDEPNSMLKHELYSYFNGKNHYGYSVDAVPIRITPIISASKTTSFFMRIVPISLARLLSAQNNGLFTKVDDDQLRYGYSVTMDGHGGMHFYVKNDYRQYHLWIKNAYADRLTDPLFTSGGNFQFENYNTQNFPTNYGVLCTLVDEQLPFDDWFFKYNPTTHNMTAIKTSINNPAVIVTDTSLVTPAPIVSCPAQEGKWTHSGTVQNTIYDNSGNNRNGSITNIATGGVWNDDNTLTNLGGDSAGTGANALQIDFGAITPLNTLTEFTIAFWFNPLDNTINPHNYYERIVTKAGQGPSEIWVERRSSLNELEFSISNGSSIYTLVRFPNAFPAPNKWYFIVAKWKSGENLKISINNIQVQSSTTLTHTISNSANNLSIFNTNKSPNSKVALFKMWNTQITQLQQDDLYLQGYHNPLFPKSENIQPEPEETPDPILIPFSTVYFQDKMTTPTAADYRKINSLAGDSPLIPLYDVADGSSTVDPELNPYTIADGVSTGGGPTSFTLQYQATDPSNNSSSQLSGATGNQAVVVELTSTSSTLNGKKPTKAVFYLSGANTPTGTIKCLVWNAAGTQVTELWLNGTVNNRLSAASLTGTHTAYTFQNTDLTPWGATSMGVGWKIGIEYSGAGDSSDEVRVKRNRSNPRVNEWANSRDSGGWGDNPDDIDDDDLVADIYDGGTGTPVVDPWVIMKTGSYNRVAEAFGAGDPLLTKLIGKVTLRLKKSGSPTGTATVVLQSSTNVVKATFSPTLNVSTGLTTSFADYTFTNYTHGQPVASTDRIAILWTPSASGEVHVGTNSGNTGGGNAWNGTNSATFRYIASWTAESTTDLAGKIYTGGNNFDAYIRTSETVTRIAVKAVNNQSDLHNKKITKVVARIKKVGTPSGIITCRIRDPSDTQRVLFSSVDINSLTTSYTDVVFENYTHTYLMNSATGSGDKVVFEYSGSSSSNYLEFNMNHDLVNTSNLATIVQYYNGNYVDQAQYDMAGEMYSGGEPDLNSRTRVAQSVEHQDSVLKGKKITRVKQYLYRTNTSVSGTVYCNIRRGSDDALIKSLGAGFSVSSLSSTASNPTFVEFTDTTNNYPMTIDDKISIEFSGGNSTDQVGVLVRSLTPTNYDGSFSFIRKYNEIDWDDQEGTYDLCATMNEGGFEYTPDPGSIPDPTPVNDKDLIYLAGNNKASGFLECFIMEFRIYSKDITLDNANYLFENRYSISAIGPGAISMPLNFKMNTTDPV